ncbi:tetratricopeptide repeat protein [Citrobacter sp.]|uniref:tetratricopeptide repeat protein n=1 Tax=Citrobacter sp. TaxID=1896336 RepID=UPI002FC8E4FF
MKEVKYEIKAEFDFDSKTLVGTIKSGGDQVVDESSEFKNNLFDIMKNSLSNFSSEYAEQIKSFTEKGEYDEAYFSALESLKCFHLLKDDYYFALKELSYHLNDIQLKSVCMYLVAFSSQFCLVDELEKDVETCLRLKDESMSELEEMSLYIEKSRVLYEKGSFNASYAVLQEVIKKTKNNMILGCAFRNLARLATQTEDFELYSNKAIDNFIVSGNKKEAISVIFTLLERVEGKNDTVALELIDKAIELQSSDSYIGKGYLATLLQRKGSILINLNRHHDAKEPILMACALRRGVLGEEPKLHASLVKAEIVLRFINENDAADEIQEEYQQLELTIKDEGFVLTNRILNSLSSDEVSDLKFGDVLSDDLVSPHMKFGCLMVEYLNGNYDFSKNIEILDKALAFAIESKDYKAKAMALNEMSRQYAENGYVPTAIEKLYESIDIDSKDMESFQNLIFFLLQEKRLDEACDLLKHKIDIVGSLPNLTFTYAKTLFENKRYQEAYKYFKIVSEQGDTGLNDQDKIIRDYIVQCIDNIDELSSGMTGLDSKSSIEISLSSLSSAFDDFSASISSLSRMQYWIKDDKKIYKWVSNPEAVAKHHLLQFLSARFGGELELVQEDRAGAGFIDLYLIAKNGLKFVVELKMCGSGYSSTYAISGESQIIHYLENKDTNVGFLIVFDSRSRDFSKGLEKFKTYGNFSIYTKVIDVRNVIDK